MHPPLNTCESQLASESTSRGRALCAREDDDDDRDSAVCDGCAGASRMLPKRRESSASARSADRDYLASNWITAHDAGANGIQAQVSGYEHGADARGRARQRGGARAHGARTSLCAQFVEDAIAAHPAPNRMVGLDVVHHAAICAEDGRARARARVSGSFRACDARLGRRGGTQKAATADGRMAGQPSVSLRTTRAPPLPRAPPLSASQLCDARLGRRGGAQKAAAAGGRDGAGAALSPRCPRTSTEIKHLLVAVSSSRSEVCRREPLVLKEVTRAVEVGITAAGSSPTRRGAWRRRQTSRRPRS